MNKCETSESCTLVAERTKKSGQTIAVSRDVMAGNGAVNTLRTRLVAVMSVEARCTN